MCRRGKLSLKLQPRAVKPRIHVVKSPAFSEIIQGIKSFRGAIFFFERQKLGSNEKYACSENIMKKFAFWIHDEHFSEAYGVPFPSTDTLALSFV